MSDSVRLDPVVLTNPEDIHVPVSHSQVDNLVGKLLTLIDATGLPPEQGKAVKDLARQHIRTWHSDAVDTARTSYRGCLAPLVMLRNANGTERGVVWESEGRPTLFFDEPVPRFTAEISELAPGSVPGFFVESTTGHETG